MSYARRRLLSLVVVLPLLGACSTAPPPPTTAPPTTAQSVSASPGSGSPTTAQAQQATDRFVRSLREHDRAAFDALISDRDPGFAPTATMLFDNLQRLEPTNLSFTLTGRRVDLEADRRRVLGSSAVALEARVTWQVPGDAAAADHLVTLAFVADAGGPLIAGTIDGPQQREPLWWFTPVRTARDGDVTVIGSAGVEVDTWLPRAVRAARCRPRHRHCRSGSHRRLERYGRA